MAQIMLSYVKDQPRVWKELVDRRKELTASFVEANRDKNICRVVLLGSGSSNTASHIAQEFYQSVLGVEVLVEAPTRIDSILNLLDKASTLFVAVSQSGKSTSTIGVIRQLQEKGITVTGVTANPGSPIAGQCDSHVTIACGEELVGPKTKGMTSTALTLYLMGLELFLAKGTLPQAVYDKTIADLLRSFSLAGENIEKSIAWSRKNADELKKVPHMIFVAEGMNYPVAVEGALKVLETLYIPVFAYEFEEYLHGVNNTISDQSYLFLLVPDSHNRERLLRLNAFSSEHGSHNYIVSTGKPTGVENELFLASSGNDVTLPFETLLPFHVISALVSEDKGINCDKPKFSDYAAKMETKA